MTMGGADVSMSQYLALRIQVMTAASTPCPHAAVFADILICICSEAQPSPACTVLHNIIHAPTIQETTGTDREPFQPLSELNQDQMRSLPEEQHLA